VIDSFRCFRPGGETGLDCCNHFKGNCKRNRPNLSGHRLWERKSAIKTLVAGIKAHSYRPSDYTSPGRTALYTLHCTARHPSTNESIKGTARLPTSNTGEVLDAHSTRVLLVETRQLTMKIEGQCLPCDQPYRAILETPSTAGRIPATTSPSSVTGFAPIREWRLTSKLHRELLAWVLRALCALRAAFSNRRASSLRTR
jgi:hypothetical protein